MIHIPVPLCKNGAVANLYYSIEAKTITDIPVKDP